MLQALVFLREKKCDGGKYRRVALTWFDRGYTSIETIK